MRRKMCMPCEAEKSLAPAFGRAAGTTNPEADTGLTNRVLQQDFQYQYQNPSCVHGRTYSFVMGEICHYKGKVRHCKKNGFDLHLLGLHAILKNG